MSFKIINRETINHSMMGNTEMVKQFVDLYLAQSPSDFKALEDAILSQDMGDIRAQAHHIKPTMQYIGANALLQEFQSLEDMAKAGESITEINTLFNQIKPNFLLMLDELNIVAQG